jgi:hypothetical protein
MTFVVASTGGELERVGRMRPRRRGLRFHAVVGVRQLLPGKVSGLIIATRRSPNLVVPGRIRARSRSVALGRKAGGSPAASPSVGRRRLMVKLAQSMIVSISLSRRSKA